MRAGKNGCEALRDIALGLMPRGFGCAVLSLEGATPAMLPDEQAAVARAVPKRRHEFALGRLALRQALAGAGHDWPQDRPIAALPDRRPDLPRGVRASLSHSGGYCIALAAPAGGPWVGVDIESRLRPPPEGLAGVVAPYRGAGSDPLLVFCIKEALFKAQFPLTGRMLGFHQVPLVIRQDRARACLGNRLIAARWAQSPEYFLSVSLWNG